MRDIRIRELGPGEAEVVAAVFAGLTPEQRYHRFHTGVTRLTKAMLHRLSAPDSSGHVALVAEAEGQPVGLARYVSVEKGRADVAVEVVHQYTRRGLGRSLLRCLQAHAVRNGVARLDMVITRDNGVALRLASQFGVRLEAHADVFTGTLHLLGSA